VRRRRWDPGRCEASGSAARDGIGGHLEYQLRAYFRDRDPGALSKDPSADLIRPGVIVVGRGQVLGQVLWLGGGERDRAADDGRSPSIIATAITDSGRVIEPITAPRITSRVWRFFTLILDCTSQANGPVADPSPDGTALFPAQECERRRSAQAW
jgi:hypothetical protein